MERNLTTSSEFQRTDRNRFLLHSLQEFSKQRTAAKFPFITALPPLKIMKELILGMWWSYTLRKLPKKLPNLTSENLYTIDCFSTEDFSNKSFTFGSKSL